MTQLRNTLIEITPVDEKYVPTAEGIFYNFMSVDALDFEINCIKKCMDLLEDLFVLEIKSSKYPESSLTTQMKYYLNIQLLSKYCHFAETLGFVALAYMNPQSTLKPFPSKENQIKDLAINIKSLGISDTANFYQSIGDKSESMIAEVMAYPTLQFQSKENKTIFENSCKNIKLILQLIGETYTKLRGFYNAYKHGYRIVPFRYGEKDGMLYLDEKKNNPMLLFFDKDDVNRIFELSRYCRNILQSISENHKIKMKVGDLSKEVKVTFDIFSKSGEQIAKQSLDRIVYNRRNDTKNDHTIEKHLLKESGDNKKFLFKWVMFDLDEKRIIAFHQNHMNLIKTFYDSNIENEISIIKITNKFIDDIKRI